ncbi:MAG: cupin domain-containing protein [Gemmatimonadales bacterium]
MSRDLAGPAEARAAELIGLLGLDAHPEGGYFRVHRSPNTVLPADGRPPRSALTTIYFLLIPGQHSRWHRVRSDEVWHHYEGAPLELFLGPPRMDRVLRLCLGPDGKDQSRIHAVPAGWWQAARPRGGFSLVGCTVGPGFEFEDFGFLRDDAAALRVLQRLDPTLAQLA